MRILVAAILASHAAGPTLVTFNQSGGFAGFDRGLTVKRTGAVVSDGLPLKKPRLTATELAKLRAALAAARFETLPKLYKPDQPIADGFVYRITYGGHAVRIAQGANPPTRVQRVFDLLRRLTSAA